jgi:hypothetical protein
MQGASDISVRDLARRLQRDLWRHHAAVEAVLPDCGRGSRWVSRGKQQLASAAFLAERLSNGESRDAIPSLAATLELHVRLEEAQLERVAQPGLTRPSARSGGRIVPRRLTGDHEQEAPPLRGRASRFS